jgi:hypothetical protein
LILLVLRFPQFLPQDAGTFESDDLAGRQHDCLAGLWIASPALILPAHTKLAKTGYQDVFTAFQSLLYDLEKCFDDAGRFGFRENVFGKEIFYNFCFG